MDRIRVLRVVAALALVVQGSAVGAQQQNVDGRDPAAEAAARQAFDAFITEWNTADDANLRGAMHFPFVSVAGGGALIIDDQPEDFSAGFDRMRANEGWSRSSFDFDSFTVVKSSRDKVHAEVGFSRYRADGTTYLTARVFYVVTRRDDDWRIQLRTGAASPADLDASERAEIVDDARHAVLDFFTAFNAGDADATVETLNHPHLFITPPGRFVVAETPDDGPRQNFDEMRQREGWHMSTIDSLEASIVTRNKVHFEMVFSRWHPNGTRYWTVPALWIVTRAGDHWGIQVRSLMPATWDTRGSP